MEMGGDLVHGLATPGGGAEQVLDQIRVVGQMKEKAPPLAAHPVDQHHLQRRVGQAIQHHPFVSEPVHSLLDREVVGQILRVLYDVLDHPIVLRFLDQVGG